MPSSDVSTSTSVITHPQPLGIFPFPAGLLLLPEDDGSGEITQVRSELLQGRLPEHWPESLRGHELVHSGDEEGALVAFTGTDLSTRWNRWLLDPSTEDVEEVRAALPESLLGLVDVARFGLADDVQVPDLPADAPAEMRALVLATRATQRLERAEVDAAAELLQQAAAAGDEVAPVLGGLFRANAAALVNEHLQDPQAARADLEAAAAALTGSDLTANLAEIHHQLGSIAHEVAAADGAPLHTAMHHYNTTLQLVTEDDHPSLWASAHLNLATAYLSTPMSDASDQLRHGVAAQALRACLRVFTKERFPAEWSSATLNLANALVYTPSTHQGDNLVEAVELYEEVLEARPRESDPIGRARVLTNQGNVLAHLGIFDQAKAKLVEARFLFEESLDSASAMSVRSVLDEIARASTEDLPEDGSLSAESTRQMAQMSRMGATETS